MSSLQVRTVLIAVLVLLFAFISATNFFSKEERIESPLLVDDGLRLGLDLQGGIHWVVGVELDEAIKRELEFQLDVIVRELEDENVTPTLTRVAGGRFTIGVANAEQAAQVRSIAEDIGILI